MNTPVNLYKLLIGRSGYKWAVALNPTASVRIWAESDPEHRGLGGHKIVLPLDTGDTLELEGPWASNAIALFEDTGYDVRKKEAS